MTIPERKIKRRWQLTKRDKQILFFLLKNRFATSGRIGRLFFKSLTSRAHKRRLRLLKRRGYLELHPDFSGHLPVYRLTKHGLRVLKRAGAPAELLRFARRINKETFRHDELLQDLRLIFESSPLVSHFLPEHIVRARLAKKHGYQKTRESKYKVPDALFALQRKNSKLTVALELELAIKSRERRQKMLAQLSTSSDFNLIFLVVGEASQHKVLEQALTKLRQSDPAVRAFRPEKNFYFALISDLLHDKLHAPFSGEGTTFTLAGLAESLPQAASDPVPPGAQKLSTQGDTLPVPLPTTETC